MFSREKASCVLRFIFDALTAIRLCDGNDSIHEKTRNGTRYNRRREFLRSGDFVPTFFNVWEYASLLLSVCVFWICFYHRRCTDFSRNRREQRDFDRKKYLIRNFLACRQKFLPNFRPRVHFRPLHRYPAASRSDIPWRCKIVELFVYKLVNFSSREPSEEN